MFPVFVLMRDSGEVLRFESLQAMTSWLEPVDVANAEYSAWSSNGEPLHLRCNRDSAMWLAVDVSETSNGSLADALRGFAGQRGVASDALEGRSYSDQLDLIEGTSPNRKNRRWPWVFAGILVIASIAVWWNWPHLDPKLIGQWQVISGLQFHLAPDGTCLVRISNPGSRGQRAGLGAFWECRGSQLRIHVIHSRGLERLKDEVRQQYAKWSGRPWFMFRFRIVEKSSDSLVAELVEGQLHGPDAVKRGGRITWKRQAE